MLRDHAVTPRTNAQENWPAVLDRYGVQYLVLDIEDDCELLRQFGPELPQQFRAEPQWVVDLKGRESVLLSRTRMRQEAPTHPECGTHRGSLTDEQR
jgi:hypothetical protein